MGSFFRATPTASAAYAVVVHFSLHLIFTDYRHYTSTLASGTICDFVSFI